MVPLEGVLITVMVLVVAFMVGAIVRRVFHVAVRVVFGVLTIASLLLFMVMADSARVSASLAAGDKTFVLRDGDRLVTGFSIVGDDVTLWKEGQAGDVSGAWALSFSEASFDDVETVELFKSAMPAVLVADVILSDDVGAALAEAASKMGLPRGVVLDVSTTRSKLFSVLVAELFETEDLFDLVRSGKVVIAPDRVTFKFMRSVPDILVPLVKPFTGAGLDSDGVAG